MKLVGLNKLLVPVAVVAVSLLSACGNTKYAKQTHGGSASANNLTVTTKPKIDVVVFQDDSDSIIRNGPLETLKPQMASFLSNMSGDWDYRFTVMPLLTTNLQINSKYVVSTDCSSVTNVMGCLAPSQHSTFNYSSGDYGWINSANFVGGDDRGFATMVTHINRMRNSGFIRPDAALAVIVLSNADDLEGVGYTTRNDGVVVRDYNTSAEQTSFNNYYSYFSTLKGSSMLSKFYPVVVNSSGSCLNGYYGKRYVEMANALSSRAYNICNGELNSSLNDIKQQLVAVTQAIRFNYVVISADRQPVVSSIKVFKNGVEIPQSNSNGWSYVGYASNQPTSYYPTSGNVRTGYMIRLNGSAVFQGSDNITFDFDPL
jgi:hypothetical protein